MRACFGALALMVRGMIAIQVRSSSEAEQSYPVHKVVKTLESMHAQLLREQAVDGDLHDKMQCWCKTQRKLKEDSIAAANYRIAELEAGMEEAANSALTKTSNIKTTNQELKENQDSANKATAIRHKQNKEFTAKEQEDMQNIQALRDAIEVLSKHHPASFLQANSGRIASAGAQISQVMLARAALFAPILTHSEQEIVASFVQAVQSPEYLRKTPTFREQYESRSGQIIGILKQMLEEMEKDLSAAQREELSRVTAFNSLRAAKNSEIKLGESQVQADNRDRAADDERKADLRDELHATRAQLKQDAKDLEDINSKCTETEREFQVRSKDRSLELVAVAEAIQVLNADTSRDNFAKTVSFVQKARSMLNTPALSRGREEAKEILSAAAQKLGSAHLAMLAMSVQLDAFTKVKQAIDGMISRLEQQKADEVKDKNYCDSNRDETELAEKDANRRLASAQKLIAYYEPLIAETIAEIEQTKTQIAGLRKSIQRAGETREVENADYQETVTDQRETQRLIQQAIKILAKVYGPQKPKQIGLVQAVQDPTTGIPTFSAYSQNTGGMKVLKLLQDIYKDSVDLEKEALRDEASAQFAYETYVKDSNEGIALRNEKLADLKQAQADFEAKKVKAEEARDKAENDSKAMAQQREDFVEMCTFIWKNFDLRQAALSEEVQALREAKQVLSGSNFQA